MPSQVDNIAVGSGCARRNTSLDDYRPARISQKHLPLDFLPVLAKGEQAVCCNFVCEPYRRTSGEMGQARPRPDCRPWRHAWDPAQPRIESSREMVTNNPG